MWKQTGQHDARAEHEMEAHAKPERRLRVLLIAPSLEMLGGQSRQCARLLGHLQKEPSLEVSFLAVNPLLPGFLRGLQKIRYVRSVVTTLLFWTTLFVRVWRYDILHIFSAAYYSYALSAMLPLVVGKILGKKTILNYRSGEAEDHLANWRTAIPTMRLADAIVTPSGYLVDVFARFGLRASPIFNIIELDRFHFRERAPLRPVFLTSRLLEPLYNVPCVLRAFKIIQEHYPEASLTVAGEGYLRAELEELARTLSLRDTKFIGRVPFDEMPQMYDGADVYLTATNLDNMPSSITECLAAGLPVVTTGAGGIPYIVKDGETCLMFPLDDHEAMAAAALRLLEDSELASQIARRGREHSHQWTWEEVRNRWLGLYQELGSELKEVGSKRKAAL